MNQQCAAVFGGDNTARCKFKTVLGFWKWLIICLVQKSLIALVPDHVTIDCSLVFCRWLHSLLSCHHHDRCRCCCHHRRCNFQTDFLAPKPFSVRGRLWRRCVRYLRARSSAAPPSSTLGRSPPFALSARWQPWDTVWQRWLPRQNIWQCCFLRLTTCLTRSSSHRHHR